MQTNIKPFDISTHLEADADIQAFLDEVAATGNASDFLHALNTAAKAKGMSVVAEQAGVTRASLYKSLAPGGNPRFETISRIVEGFGCHLSVSRAE